ncbi:pilin [Candidatus Parcubacteria bacterium]|nr:pilin [Candidatus Parcubacteria bacterium]
MFHHFLNSGIKFQKTFVGIAVLGMVFAGLISFMPASASAQKTGELCSGANLDLGNNKRSCQTRSGVSTTKGGKLCDGQACSDRALNNLIRQVVNVFSIIVGVVAVIMIIYGGFRYVASGGESGNISTAKNTLIYALVGLIIVALAQVIVKFVLNRVTS